MKINGIPLHDFHLHTGLSPCAGHPIDTPERYAPIAAQNGLEIIGITEHMWDRRIPVPGSKDGLFGPGYLEIWNQLTFERQYAHMAECERLQHGVKILYGVEAELFSGVLGLHESSAALLDFVSVAHDHFHQGPPALPEGYKSHEGLAYYMMKTFDEMLEYPFVDMSAHPFDPCILNRGKDLERIYELVGRDRFAQSLQKAKEKSISIEINMSLSCGFGDETFEKTFLWMWRLAKEIGCLFHFGSDAHTGERLAEVTIPENYKRYIDALGLTPGDMHPLVFQ